MIIIYKNEKFDMPEDFSAERIKTNIVFAEYGEQTAPVTLPWSPKNIRLLSYSGRLDDLYKPINSIRVHVIDGLLSMPCNMVLNAPPSKKNGISCTLYFGMGDFYSRIDKKKLRSLDWPKITIDPPGVYWDLDTRRANWIKILKSEYKTPTPDCWFCIAPVISAEKYNWKVQKPSQYGGFTTVPVTEELVLNGWDKNSFILFEQSYVSSGYTLSAFAAETERIKVVDGIDIPIKKGYGMTPLMKLKYAVKFVFSQYDYACIIDDLCADNYCIINNVADAIYAGVVNQQQLVPDLTISDFIKFIEENCVGKFFVDEFTRTVEFISLEKILVLEPDLDLTPYLCDEAVVMDPEFAQVVLKFGDKQYPSETVLENTEVIDLTQNKEMIVSDIYNAHNYDNPKTSLTIPYRCVQVDSIVHANTNIVVNGEVVSVDGASLDKLVLAHCDVNFKEMSTFKEATPSGFKVYYKEAVQQQPSPYIDKYKVYVELKLNSYIPVTADMIIPESILEPMCMYRPKVLCGQKVFIEKIVAPMGVERDCSVQKVSLRTVQSYASRH